MKKGLSFLFGFLSLAACAGKSGTYDPPQVVTDHPVVAGARLASPKSIYCVKLSEKNYALVDALEPARVLMDMEDEGVPAADGSMIVKEFRRRENSKPYRIFEANPHHKYCLITDAPDDPDFRFISQYVMK